MRARNPRGYAPPDDNATFGETLLVEIQEMRDNEIAVECGPGWRSLYAPLIDRCKAEGVAVLQIKEKFGGLRFYVMDGSDELHAVINKAEAKSVTICEQCGSPGELRKGGWRKTLCDQHAQELDRSRG